MLLLFQGDKGDQGEMVRKDNIIKELCKNIFIRTVFQKSVHRESECRVFI